MTRAVGRATGETWHAREPEPVPVVFLMGPTAAGKTDAAIRLVQELDVELISVDSALVYRGMDVGTAKPDTALLKRAPHRLINLREPDQPYSAADFLSDACAAIREIDAAGRLPVLVGGTMMYFHVLEHGLAPMPPADPAVRARLEAEAAACGLEALHGRLTTVDPESAARIHPNDPQRIQRALEVWEITGQPISKIQKQNSVPPMRLKILKLALSPSCRNVLHERIEKRFDGMLADGFLQEVRQLMQRGSLHPDLPALRAVGYRQVWRFLSGEYDEVEMKRRAIVATRQLAKRQLTWLRRQDDVHWIAADSPDASDLVLSLVTGFARR